MAELKNCTNNFYPELCAVNVTIDPTQLLGFDDDRALIIAELGTGATATPGTVYAFDDQTRGAVFGVGSMANAMIDRFRASSPTTKLHIYPVAANGASGKSVVTITGVTTLPSAVTAFLIVNGATYTIAIDPATDTDTTVAAAFAAVIAVEPNVTTAAAANVLTITTIGKGVVNGFLDVRKAYGLRAQSNPAALGLAIVTSGQTGYPDATGIAALAQGFEFIVNPYTNTPNVAAVSVYLCAQWSGTGVRSRQFAAHYGSSASAAALAQTTNNALQSFIAVRGALTPPALVSASYGGIAFRGLNCQSDDVAASLTGAPIPFMLAPETVDQFTSAEKAALIEVGMGVVNVDRINQVSIGRAVTTYTVADNGTLDQGLRDVNRPSLIACISRFLQDSLTARYTGYAFRADGVVGSTSNKVATTRAIRNYMIGLVNQLSDRNLVQDIDGLVQSLDVRFNPLTGCVSIGLSPTLVQQFCCATIALRTI